MLQDILKIQGVKVLSKAEQKNVKGGGTCCDPELDCCMPGGEPFPGCRWVFSSPPFCV